MIETPEHWERGKDVEFPSVSLGAIATSWRHKLLGLTVLRSKSTTKDGVSWVHVSVSKAMSSDLPSWFEMSKVKNDFFGDEIEAYIVMAKKSEHVNICHKCLHIWAPVDGIRRVANLHDLINEEAI
jgi:hypothetical protein